MTKKELLKYLEPFDDDIEIINKSRLPYFKLKYTYDPARDIYYIALVAQQDRAKDF